MNYLIILCFINSQSENEDYVVEELPDIGVGGAIDHVPVHGQVDNEEDIGIDEDEVDWF